MPYDVTIITVKPNTHMKALPGVEQWLKANPRKGEFIGCLASEIGDLNKIMLLHHYDSEADLAADRDGVARDANPFGCLDLTDGHVDRHLRASSRSCRAIKPGQLRPDLRGAHLSAEAERAGPDHRGLGEAGAGAAEALADPRRDVFGHRRGHALHAYLALSETWTCARNTRKTAIETGVWPPPGGPDHLLTMHTDIFLPAPFSPIR